MRHLIVGLVATAVLAVAVLAVVQAQDERGSGPIRIEGEASQSVILESGVNVATGSGSRAVSTFAHIGAGSRAGGVRQDVVIGDHVNQATGSGALACTHVATIGGDDLCRHDR